MNQKGKFVCPGKLTNIATQSKITAPAATVKLKLVTGDPFDLVVVDLQNRGSSRPGKPDRLLNTIRSTLTNQGKEGGLAEGIQSKLIALGFVTITEARVTYALPKRAA